jgi:hypothetical protein
MADVHTLLKLAVNEVANRAGRSATFMGQTALRRLRLELPRPRQQCHGGRCRGGRAEVGAGVGGRGGGRRGRRQPPGRVLGRTAFGGHP